MKPLIDIYLSAVLSLSVLLLIFTLTAIRSRQSTLKIHFLLLTFFSTLWTWCYFQGYIDQYSGVHHNYAMAASNMIWPFNVGLIMLFVLELTQIVLYKRFLNYISVLIIPVLMAVFSVNATMHEWDSGTESMNEYPGKTVYYFFYYGYIFIAIGLSLALVYFLGLKSEDKKKWYIANTMMTGSLLTMAASAFIFIFLHLTGGNVSHAMGPVPLIVYLSVLAYALNRDRIKSIDLVLKADTIINAVSEGVLILDGSFRIKKLNKAMLSIIECALKADIIDMPLTRFVQTDQSNYLANEISTRGFLNDKEMTVVFYNNKTRTVSLSARTIKDTFDNVSGYIIFFKDITQLMRAQGELLRHKDELEKMVQERTKALDEINTKLIAEIVEKETAEKRIRESEEMFRLLIEIAQDAIYTVDSNGVITSVNKAMTDITGFSREELMGRNFAEFMHPDELQYALEVHNLIQNKVKPPIFELRYLHKEGHYNYAEFSASPIIKNGQSIGTLGVGRDITLRKKTEYSAIEREQRFKFIIENASEIIYTMTLEGRFEFISNNMYALSGYKPDDVIGRYFYDFVFAEDLPVALEGFRNLSSNNKPLEFRVVTKNKNILYMRASSKIIDLNGTTCVSGVMTDITDLKKAEESLKITVEEKNILLREVHHRVKNNLQVVISMLKLEAISLNDTGFSNTLHSFIERLNSMKLVHEQLYKSDNIKELDVKSYINNLVRQVENSFSNAHTAVELRVSCEKCCLSPDVLTPVGLILNEMITNSFKYAFPEHIGLIEIEFRCKKEQFHLTYKDNGIGFDSSIINKGTSTLGFKLIQALTSQLEGTFEASTENGVRFDITFSAKNDEVHF